MTSISKSRFSALIPTLVPFFLFPLAVHGYLGTYSRFMADDFCSAATAQSLGIVRGAAWWYVNWSGRFSANILDSVFGYLGPRITPSVTLIILIVWFGALICAAASTFRLLLDRPSISVCVLTAAVLLFVVVEITPNVGQSLYWGQGMRSVIPPLILGTVFAMLVTRSAIVPGIKFGWIVAAAALTFIAGGFSETYVALQTVSITLALVVTLLVHPRKRRLISILLAGLIGSVTALGIVVSAPGNAVRRTPFPEPAWQPLLRISLDGFLQFFTKLFATKLNCLSLVGLAVFAFALGGFFFGEKRDGPSSATLLSLPIAGLLLLFSCHVPIAYGASLNLPDRTLVIPAYLLVALLFVWFVLLGIKVRSGLGKSAWAAAAVVVFLIFFAGTAMYAGLRRAGLAPAFRNYAHEWDVRDAAIRDAKSRGDRFVQVRRLYNLAALDEVEPDPKILWLTKCVQDYYGISVLTDYDGQPDANADYRQRQSELAAEAIKTPPLATPATLNSFYKPGRGVVRFFKTDASYDQLKTHYESQLTQDGWKLIGERKLEIFQRYPGAMQALFCKDGYAANLFYTGAEAQRLGYNYSLAINWGLSSGFVWGVEDCK